MPRPPRRRGPSKEFLDGLRKRRLQQAAASAAAAKARARAEEARARQRAAEARERQQAAQRRRAQEEQRARLAEQKRRQEAANRAAAAKARAQARTARAQQRRRHTVKRGDTAESIGAKYGVPPADIAGKVKRLRPGQRIPIGGRPTPGGRHTPGRPRPAPLPDTVTTAGEAPIGYDPRALPQGEVEQAVGGGGLVQPGLAIGPQTTITKNVIGYGYSLMPTVARVLSRVGYALAETDIPGTDVPLAPTSITDPLRGLDEQAAELVESVEYKMAVGQEIPRADLAEYNKLRRPPGGIHDQMEEMANKAIRDRAEFAIAMRYTGEALAHAYDLMLAGEDYSHVVAGGTGMFEGNVLYIESAEWAGGAGKPMWEQFTPDMREKIKELGYVQYEKGLWVPLKFMEEDYGMGGYTYPGYGGLGFPAFGGGDYEYLSRGGVRRPKAGGGSSKGERARIFAEGISPAHWRI